MNMEPENKSSHCKIVKLNLHRHQCPLRHCPLAWQIQRNLRRLLWPHLGLPWQARSSQQLCRRLLHDWLRNQHLNMSTLIFNVKVASTLGSESGLGGIAHRLDSMEIEGLASFDTRDSDSEDEAIEEGRRKKRQVSISFLSSGWFLYCFALNWPNYQPLKELSELVLLKTTKNEIS